jgi:adenylate cyclase
MTFTAMGGMVNLANRLEGLNKLYGTQILVSDTTRIAAGSRFVFRPIDIVIAKGTALPMPVHELLGLAEGEAPAELRADAAAVASLKVWTACVAAYREGRFDDARDALAVIGCNDGFPVAAIYAARLADLGRVATEGWSPAVRLTVK